MHGLSIEIMQYELQFVLKLLLCPTIIRKLVLIDLRLLTKQSSLKYNIKQVVSVVCCKNHTISNLRHFLCQTGANLPTHCRCALVLMKCVGLKARGQ